MGGSRMVSVRTFWATALGTALFLAGVLCLVAGEDEKAAKREPPIIGRWDLVVQTPDGEYPSWFEVRRSGYHTLVGSLVGQFGSARPISQVEIENGRFRFTV